MKTFLVFALLVLGSVVLIAAQDGCSETTVVKAPVPVVDASVAPVVKEEAKTVDAGVAPIPQIMAIPVLDAGTTVVAPKVAPVKAVADAGTAPVPAPVATVDAGVPVKEPAKK